MNVLIASERNTFRVRILFMTTTNPVSRRLVRLDK